MSKKLTVALFASIAALSFGSAYAAGEGGDKADKSATGASATGSAAPGATAKDQAGKKAWTKEKALKNGLTEQQFLAADVNTDGKLDEQELKAANIVESKSMK